MAVNLSPYGGVGAQFLDNAGNVLTGGKIYTYAGGTTTPQVTYIDGNGATPHSNPIILDASGRVPGGEIWLTDGQVYKFVLKDSNDVLIATYDGITGINSNFVAFVNQQEIQTATAGQTVFNLTTMTYQPGTNSLSVFVDGVNQYGPGSSYAYLETDSDTVTFVTGLHVGAEVKFTTSNLNSSASVNDAEQISYIPPFTGSVATNVEAKLAQTVSVTDFGADSTGLTNSTTEIQAAIDYLTSIGGGILNVPTGTYEIDTIQMKSNVYVACDSGVTFNKTPGTLSDNNNAFNFYGSETATLSSLTANVSVGDLSVAVTSATGFAENDWCLLRDNVYISGSAGRNQEIVQIRSIVGTTVNLYSNTIGAYTTAQSAQLVKILPVENATLDGGEIVVPIGTNNGGGITTKLCLNSAIKNVSVYNAQDNASIAIYNSYNINVTESSCFNGQNLSSGGYGYAFSVGDSSHHVRITNCHQQSVRESSITDRARFVVFANNTGLYSYDNFVNTHGSGCENVVIANNTSSGGNAGITVGFGTHTAGDKNVLVTGNVISDTYGGGISVSGPLGKEHTNVVVSNNLVTNPCLSIVTQCMSFSSVIDGACINNYIDANNSANATYGILSSGATNINIQNNYVLNIFNGYGISNQSSDNVIISENTVRNVSSYNYRILSTTKNSFVSNNYSDDTLIQFQGYLVTAGSFVVGRQYKIVSIGTTDFTLIGAAANTVGLYFVATGVGTGTGTADSVSESPNVFDNSFQIFNAVINYDPPSLNDGDGVTTTITVTGARLGDYVGRVSFSNNLQGVILNAWVSATNTVSVRFQNETGGVVDLASGVLRVQVFDVFN